MNMAPYRELMEKRQHLHPTTPPTHTNSLLYCNTCLIDARCDQFMWDFSWMQTSTGLAANLALICSDLNFLYSLLFSGLLQEKCGLASIDLNLKPLTYYITQ